MRSRRTKALRRLLLPAFTKQFASPRLAYQELKRLWKHRIPSVVNITPKLTRRQRRNLRRYGTIYHKEVTNP